LDSQEFLNIELFPNPAQRPRNVDRAIIFAAAIRSEDVAQII
jgi:hypothetical protein